MAFVKIVVTGGPAENLGGIDIKGRNKLVANSELKFAGSRRTWESVIFRRIKLRPPPLLRVITAKQRKC